MKRQPLLLAPVTVASTATTAFAAGENTSSGGGLLLLVIVAAIVYSFSSIGRYDAGFKAGADARQATPRRQPCVSSSQRSS